ncbi:MAG: acetylxylan esterase [Clostridia bacterium]|nr:acetylxylan esterase [Clostridia bacterium]
MKTTFRVLDHIPKDDRLVLSRNTRTVFQMPTFSSLEEIDRRREELRFNLRMSAGLYPWPEKTPLNVRRELVGDFDGYSIEKIMIETRPGLWTTGNLYMPRPLTGKAPAILNVIGHWWDQRLTRSGEGDYPQQIANFARMGFVCLVLDMIGMVDNKQLDHYYGQKEKDMWLSSGLGIQLWNNIRAVDYLCSLPEVDADHIGVTGASGGGTQSYLLGLLDDRIKAAAPINMVSFHYAGGCVCENSPGLRRATNNVEMSAMIAPRALFLAGSTGDWTCNQETAEVPAIASVYKHYGMEDMPEHFFQDASHQYNAKTRHEVYNFFARHLMGKDIHWEEQPIQTADLLAFTWFRGEGHAPGFNNDDEFYAYHKAERTAAYAGASDAEKLAMLRWITGICDDVNPRYSQVSYGKEDGILLEKGILSGKDGEQLPYIRLTPDNWDGKSVCLALGGNGKEIAGTPAVQEKLKTGTAVVSADLFMTGEFDGAKIVLDYLEDCHSMVNTFSHTADAERAQDVALLWKAVHTEGMQCSILADGCAARAVVCALPLLDGVESAVLEKDALALDGEADYYEKCFIPGILAAGGLDSCLQLAKCPVETF